MTVTTTTERPWADAPTPASSEDWVRRAQEAAEIIAVDVVERDRAARPPQAQIDLLKDAGLVTIVGPTKDGGAGLRDDWATLLRVIRTIARVEGSIANILAWHYAQHWLLNALGTDEQRDRLESDFARNKWLSGGIVNIRDAPLVAVDEGDHLRISGRKAFNTGVPVADLIMLHAAIGEGEPFLAYAPHGAAGIELEDSWDTVGQRTTVSGPAVVTDLIQPWSDVLGFDQGHEFVPKPANTTPGLTSQLLMANMYLGLAQGSLAAGVRYTRDHSRSWLHSPYERAVDEPHVVDAYGELKARLLAVEVLVDKLGDQLTDLLSDLANYSEAKRAPLAADIAAAKLLSTEVGLDVTSQVFELTGARATDRSFGLDRYWRDLRTHSLHDPVGYKRRQVGAWLLRDEPPGPPDWYA